MHRLRVYKLTTLPNLFIQAIRKIMCDRDITQAELAYCTGVNQAYLNRVLKGRQTPTLAWAERVCGALGLQVVVRDQHLRDEPSQHERIEAVVRKYTPKSTSTSKTRSAKSSKTRSASKSKPRKATPARALKPKPKSASKSVKKTPASRRVHQASKNGRRRRAG